MRANRYPKVRVQAPAQRISSYYVKCHLFCMGCGLFWSRRRVALAQTSVVIAFPFWFRFALLHWPLVVLAPLRLFVGIRLAALARSRCHRCHWFKPRSLPLHSVPPPPPPTKRPPVLGHRLPCCLLRYRLRLSFCVRAFGVRVSSSVRASRVVNQAVIIFSWYYSHSE